MKTLTGHRNGDTSTRYTTKGIDDRALVTSCVRGAETDDRQPRSSRGAARIGSGSHIDADAIFCPRDLRRHGVGVIKARDGQ